MSKLFKVLDLHHTQYLREGDTPDMVHLRYYNYHMPIRIFPDAETAKTVCAEFSLVCNRKFQPRPVPVSAVEWHEREIRRLVDGTYTLLPWPSMSPNAICCPEQYQGDWQISYRNPEAQYHFPHMSKQSPGNIAFTENDAKGAADIQTVMKPGRYLRKFYPSLTEQTVRQLANELLVRFGTVELRFATTEDEFEEVYTNGPSSCMSHNVAEFSQCRGYHPVRAYAAGDLALAYLVCKSAPDDDIEEDVMPRVSARVLCWPEKKLYGRIYGDTHKMRHMLDEAGFKEAGGWYFEGARLLKKPCHRRSNRFIVPYLDGDYQSVRDDGEFFVIDANGSVDCAVTLGFTEVHDEPEEEEEEDLVSCACCENLYEERGMRSVRITPANLRTAFICEDCDADVTSICEYSGVEFYGEHITMGNGLVWHQYYVERHAFLSNRSSEYYPITERLAMGDGSYWALCEAAEYGAQSATGTWWPVDELVKQPDGRKLHPTEVKAERAECALGDLLDSLNEPAEFQRLVTTETSMNPDGSMTIVAVPAPTETLTAQTRTAGIAANRGEH